MGLKRNLTNEERQAVWESLLTNVVDGRLAQGTQKRLASQFQVSDRTIRSIWLAGKPSIGTNIAANVMSKKKGNVGRKPISIDFDKVRSLPTNLRKNIRTVAAQLGIPKSTLHAKIKEGQLVSHSNSLKPFLTEDNKRKRIEWVFRNLEESTIRVGLTPRFQDFYDRVHIDEKWFYMTEINSKMYLVPGEEPPHRTAKSKRFISKVMFLCAVARPRWDRHKNQWFNGKLGIWPFTYVEPARRNSVNRPRGTLVTKPISSIDSNVVRNFLIQKVIPAIRDQWPRDYRQRGVIIQQDNAGPHISPDDLEFNEAANCEINFPIRLECQPPNSPDTNVLDLGFFRSIQSLQHQKIANNIDQLIENVQESFQELDRHKLNYNFLTLQQCMIETIKVGGGNNYKMPHMGKERLEREGNLPETLPCDIGLVAAAHLSLSQIKDHSN